jgi:hypothetical protein
MTVGSISSADLNEYALSSSNSTQLQQALKALQNSLLSGDLNGANSEFEIVQKITSLSAVKDENSPSSSSQLSSDVNALGGALSSGDLPASKSALASLQKRLNGAASLSGTNQAGGASQSALLTQELPSTVQSTNPSSASDSPSVAERVYGSPGSLDVYA